MKNSPRLPSRQTFVIALSLMVFLLILFYLTSKLLTMDTPFSLKTIFSLTNVKNGGRFHDIIAHQYAL